MDRITEPLLGKLRTAGYDSIEKLPSIPMDNNKVAWDLLREECPGLKGADLNTIVSAKESAALTNELEMLKLETKYTEMKAEKKAIEAEKKCAEMKCQFLEDNLRRANEKSCQLSTTRVDLSMNKDELLADMFNKAEQERFWLNPKNMHYWSRAAWSKYCTTDVMLTETAPDGGVQKLWNDEFVAKHTSPRWSFADTHGNFFQRTTQDCLMHLQDRPLSMVSIGLMIELVGQNETGFPSTAHKAKFIRDLMRLHKRRGYSGHIFGVVTDLSRIICFRLEGPVDDMRFRRTAEEGGDMVKRRMIAFLNSTPADLGISVSWSKQFDMTLCSDKSQSKMRLGEVLGTGSQGSVYTMVDGPDNCEWYIKCHKDSKHFNTEVETLANLVGVSGVVQLMAIDRANNSFAGSPICKQLSSLRGRTEVYTLAMQLLDTFEAVHTLGYGHRDGRGCNFLVLMSADGESMQSKIADWATAVKLNEDVAYEGAVHFAANSVLSNLASGQRSFPYTPNMDLESLVKTVWDLLRSRSCGVEQLSKTDFNGILAWWARAAEDTQLAKYLKYARELNYTELKNLWAK